MFNILNGIIHVPTESIVAFYTSQTQGHNYELHQLPTSTNIYARFFFLHSIKLWNSLLSSIVNCNDLKQFKSLLFQFVIN